jgi:hypothetical protein
MTKLKVIFFLCFIMASVLGCSKFSAQKPFDPVDGSFFIKGDGTLHPATDKLSSHCSLDDAFDACIYFKNPVAQEQASPADVNAVRRFGVKVRGLNKTGYLENSWVQVYALNAPRFSLASRALLKSGSDANSEVEQFSAYYWSNRVLEYLQNRVGSDRIPIKGLKIYADDAFTGYSSSNHSLHFEKKSGIVAKALSGEIVIHLLAQAIADELSGKKLFSPDQTKHNSCALDPKGCCTTEMGCAQALGNGFGEYVAAMAFPESAKVGESVGLSAGGSGGNLAGQSVCGLNRSLAALAIKTKTEVYNACSGRAVLLGAWYASLWWKLRTQLEAGEAGTGQDVDILFFDHAKAFTSTSTFMEAKAEALRLAGTYKSGKYLSAVTAALAGI